MIPPEQKVRNAIAEVLGIDASAVSDQARLANDLGADSLDEVEVTMAIEDALDVELSDEKCVQCHTVDDWIKLTLEALKAKS